MCFISDNESINIIVKYSYRSENNKYTAQLQFPHTPDHKNLICEPNPCENHTISNLTECENYIINITNENCYYNLALGVPPGKCSFISIYKKWEIFI